MTETDRIKYLRVALLLVGLTFTFTFGIWPLAHMSLIGFTVWSSIVHGGIMGIQSVADTRHIGHLWGDVAALIAVALVLVVLTPRKAATAA